MPEATLQPRLSRITIYPLKSFDPLIVPEAIVLPSGALQHDRQFALQRRDGKFFNAKRDPRIHSLSLKIDPVARRWEGKAPAEPQSRTFHIDHDRHHIEAWLSDYFRDAITIIESTERGFPDDDESPGPTIVSEASLAAVANWFPGLTIDDIRRRFRANLEVSGVPAFWEDGLFGPHDTRVRFQIGEITFNGVNPCQRCVVPSRDPLTGDEWPGFAKRFSELRESSLPAWSARDRFDHFYRLTTNTATTGSTGCIAVGDEVRLL